MREEGERKGDRSSWGMSSGMAEGVGAVRECEGKRATGRKREENGGEYMRDM